MVEKKKTRYVDIIEVDECFQEEIDELRAIYFKRHPEIDWNDNDLFIKKAIEDAYTFIQKYPRDSA